MKRQKLLRLFRSILAGLFFTGITLLLMDYSGVLMRYIGWMAKLQFLPAVLAVNLGVVAAILLCTLLFGRIYCSVICPLGVWQDAVSHLAAKSRPRRFRYSHNRRWLRLTFVAIAITGIVTTMNLLVALLAPYSSWGRIVTNLFQPLWGLAVNGISSIEEHWGIYRTYPVEIWVKSLSGLVVAGLTFLLISILAWLKGRLWCNTVCPVGTVLGCTARWSLFRPVIDYDKCIRCHKCEKNCKASCISIRLHHIDTGRCVDCFDCIAECPVGAISYSPTWGRRRHRPPHHHPGDKPAAGAPPGVDKPVDTGRRALLTTLAVALPTEALAQKTDGGLAVLEPRKAPRRSTPLVPAGAVGLDNLSLRCTACGLCISKCPENVLRPSTELGSLFQATMSYEKGWCRPECTVCSQVCPAGAIQPVKPEEKTAVHIGHAVWLKDNCLPFSQGTECGNCARHCPAGAISMVRIGNSGLAGKGAVDEHLRIPVVNEDRCIGCGACENLCPSRPFSAIYVEGHLKHRID